MLANRMKVFSGRDIDIAISSISGAASYKEISARHNLSVNRCKEIVDDVVGRVYTSEGMELHNQYQSAFIVDAINRYVDRTTHRAVATCAPNRFGGDFILHGEFINWGYLLYVLLYCQMPDGTWTMPTRDYVENKYKKNTTCQSAN